ncbi:MAG TPA: GNAT family N-acetyltransferase, partial [Dissulfurispiraceae bacterium]|nr:GNAT family N-acetyltransferase [Dissulfurispiraceae bacterium]
ISSIDGKGAQRIVGKIMNLYRKDKIVIRKADVKDMRAVYELSNDPEIRRRSFNKGDIEFPEHKEWFEKKLGDAACIFLVAEAAGVFIGQVRFDITGGEAVISISMHNRFRGVGLGREIMKKALGYLKAAAPSVETVRAYIQEENSSSIKYFEAVHFQRTGERIINDQKALEYLFRLQGGRP